MPGAERRRAGRGEVQDTAEAEDVGRRGDRLPGCLLGRDVLERPEERAGAGQGRALVEVSDAEVDHLQALPGQDHVRRLQVPVHQALGVDAGQGLPDPGRHHEDLGRGQRTVPADVLAQRRPVDEPGGHPRHRAPHIGVHDLRGVEAVHPPDGVHLPGEAFPEVRVVRQVLVDRLHRDQPTRRRTSLVHSAHTARAETSE
jgi:hypothetical protein